MRERGRDPALDGAMGLTLRQGASRQPTLAGLPLIGTEEALRRHVPTHEIAFQVMEGETVEYTRQAGFDRLQQEQLIRSHVKTHGSIRRHESVSLCQLSEDQASRLLRRLAQEQVLEAHGSGKGRYYTQGRNFHARR